MKNKGFLFLVLASSLLVGCGIEDTTSVTNTTDSKESVEFVSETQTSSNSVNETQTSSTSSNSISETQTSSASSISISETQTSLASSNSVSENSSSISYVELNDTYTGTYYNSISNNATGDTLLKSLQTLISSNYHALGYDGLWNAYETTDKVPGKNYYYDIYSNYHYTKNSPHNYTTPGTGFNREHTTPQSWWGKGTGCDQGNDAFNVYPTDGKINGIRSNYPYGECSTSEVINGSNGAKIGSCTFPGYSGKVFEPIDEYKGDLARTYFYMVTRYDQSKNPFTQAEGKVVYKNTFPYLTDYAVKLFTKWSEQDPVSQKEIDRNNAIYKLQNNRNPFIDRPSYIAKIFGTYGGVAPTPNPDPTPDPVKSYEVVDSPVVGTKYKLGLNHESSSKDLFFTGLVKSDSTPWYLQTTETYASGVDLVLETKDSGYALSFELNGTKKYINGYKSGSHYNIELRETSDTLWTYDATNKTFLVDIEGTSCFLGSSSKYNTISMNEGKYLGTSYPCHLYINK